MALIFAAVPLGRYMAKVYSGEPVFLTGLAGPPGKMDLPVLPDRWGTGNDLEGLCRGIARFQSGGLCGRIFVAEAPGIPAPQSPWLLRPCLPALAFNTAVSFMTNTNWQAYGGETTMSFLTQMAGLAVQNFASAASGMAVLLAFIRGLRRTLSRTIGNVLGGSDAPPSSISSCPSPWSWPSSSFPRAWCRRLQSPAMVQLLEQQKDEKGRAVTSQEIRPRPCGEPGGHQAAGNERRGLFQRQFGPSPGKSDAPCPIFLRCWPFSSSRRGSASPSGCLVGDRRQGSVPHRRHAADSPAAPGGLPC